MCGVAGGKWSQVGRKPGVAERERVYYDSSLSATVASLRSEVIPSTASPLTPLASAFSSSSIFFLAFSMFYNGRRVSVCAFKWGRR